MNTEDKKRCFIACPVNEDILAFLKKHRQLISALSWSKAVRWTPSDNIHLTLRFLGDTPASQIREIIDDIDNRIADTKAFTAKVLQPTAFPTIRRPTVIAAPVRPNPDLTALVNTLEDAVTAHGIAGEKRAFRGHITIARVKSPINALELICQSPEEVSMPINEIIFYQSELRREGPVYTVLSRFSLKSHDE